MFRTADSTEYAKAMEKVSQLTRLNVQYADRGAVLFVEVQINVTICNGQQKRKANLSRSPVSVSASISN